jgi:hypothetical protein
VSKRLQSSTEPKLRPRAAASQKQTSVPRFEKVLGRRGRGRGRGCLLATEARRSRRLAKPAGHSLLATAVKGSAGCQPASRGRAYSCLRYGISVRAIGRRIRPERSRGGGALPEDGLVHRASRPHAEHAVPTQRLAGHPLLWTPLLIPKPATLGPSPQLLLLHPLTVARGPLPEFRTRDPIQTARRPLP